MELSLSFYAVSLFRAFVSFCQRACLLVVLGWVLMTMKSPQAGATPLTGGEDSILFENYCAGCHPQGGNIIRRRQTLKLKSLERDGYNTIEPLTDLVANGKNNMPGFAEKLNATQIETISQFVLDAANQGWR